MTQQEKKKIVLKNEEWKLIEGYEDYEVSTWGRVWSYLSNKFLKPYCNGRGYLRVSLNPGNKWMAIHRLVAQAFIPNPDNHPIVDHIDFNTINNHVENLQWHTSLESNSKKQNRTSKYLFVRYSTIPCGRRWNAQLGPKYKKSTWFYTELEAAIQVNFWIIELGLDYPLNQLNNDPIRISAPSFSNVVIEPAIAPF